MTSFLLSIFQLRQNQRQRYLAAPGEAGKPLQHQLLRNRQYDGVRVG